MRFMREIPSQTFFRWMHYEAVEPFGERREDWRLAYLAKSIWEPQRDKKKVHEPFKAEQFLAEFLKEIGVEKEEMTPEMQKAIMLEMAISHNIAWMAQERRKQERKEKRERQRAATAQTAKE